MSTAQQTLARRLEADGVELTERDGLLIAAPQDETGVAELVRRAAQDKLHVLPIGLGSKISFCRPEAQHGHFDFALSTRYLNEVCAYEPGDGTLTAQAGCRLSDLREHVHGGGHRLTPDIPLPGSATIAGVLGAGLSGADRLYYGPVRHHVLGMRVLLADGSVAQSGGRLVKNVTGFDLHRLYTGSRGTLCITLDASLRLFPAPQAELAISYRAIDWNDAVGIARGLRGLKLRPTSLTIENRTGANVWRLHLVLAGSPAELARRRASAETLLNANCEWHEHDEAANAQRRARDLPYENGWPQLRLSGMPSRLPSAIQSAQTFFEQAGLAAEFVVQPGVAWADVWLPERESASASLLLELRQRLAPGAVQLQPFVLPAAVHAALAKDRPATPWMESLRARFDPEQRFISPHFPCLQ